MDLQHLNFKIFAETYQDKNLGSYIPVFHRWIQEKSAPEILIDVADYQHVPAGPGILLVGHHAILSMDEGEMRLGFLYNRKTALEGSNSERLKSILKSALEYCLKLEGESELEGKLQFNAGEIQITINDRLLAPNTEATDQALRPEILSFLDNLYGSGQYTLSRHQDPRERYTLDVKANQKIRVADILKRL